MIFFLPKYERDDFLTCQQLEHHLFRSVLDEWRRNYGSVRKPDYRPLCTYVRKVINGKVRTNYDLHYVNPRLSDGGIADVSFYVLKYMLKPSSREQKLQRALHLNLDEDEYNSVWSLVRSRCFYSLHFGLSGDGKRKDWKPSQRIVDYVKGCVQKSKRSSDYPQFINPVSGQHFPLSRYYKGFGDCYSVSDALDFYYNDKKSRVDNVIMDDDYDVNQLFSKDADFQHKVNDVQKKIDSNSFDDLF